MPERYGRWTTVCHRFRRWQQVGIWQRVLADRHTQADAAGTIDWQMSFIDSTVVRAHQHAAGAKGEPGNRSARRSQGGASTKLSVRCDGQGKPLCFALQPGYRHESLVFETLMDGGAMCRACRGRLRLRPKRVCGDKAYSKRRIRRCVGSVGFG